MKKNLIIFIVIIVIALGAIWYLQKYNTEPEVVDNTNQNTNDTQEIDVSDWQTYRNEELGFEFKYPGDWEHKISSDNFIYLKDSNKDYYLEGSITDLIVISTSKLPDDYFIDDWLREWTVTREKYNGSVRNIKVNNQIDAVQGFDYLGTYTVIHFNNNKYSINKVYLGSEDDYLDNIYEEVLNSFKFLD